MVKKLAEIAKQNGTQELWMAIALKWMEAANAKIISLDKELEKEVLSNFS